MKRPLRPEEVKLWAHVVATVRPVPGRMVPQVEADGVAPAKAEPAPAKAPVAGKAALRRTLPPPAAPPPDLIEPGRRRRIVRERDPIEQRLDLHGLTQDGARARLHAFLARAQDEGVRAVLVITGKGTRGDGVLRRYVPEWLAEPPSRGRVAGVSTADRRHGGEGALYVALKKKGR